MHLFSSREEVTKAQGIGRALEEKTLLVWLAIILSYPLSSKGRGIALDLSLMVAATVAGSLPLIAMFPGIINILGYMGLLAFFDCYYRLHHYGEGLHCPAVGCVKKITVGFVDRYVRKGEDTLASGSLLGPLRHRDYDDTLTKGPLFSERDDEGALFFSGFGGRAS